MRVRLESYCAQRSTHNNTDVSPNTHTHMSTRTSYRATFKVTALAPAAAATASWLSSKKKSQATMGSGPGKFPL